MRILLAFSTLFISLASFSQGLFASLDDEIILRSGVKFPSLAVRNIMTGEAANIRTLKPSDLKFGDKPTLISVWSNKYCGPCVRRINELVAAGVDKEYNILTINIDAETSISTEDLQDDISGRSGWSRLTHYRADDSLFESVFKTTTVPYWFVLDKSGKLVNSFLTYEVTAKGLKTLLSKIASKELDIAANTLYFNGDELSIKDSADTYIRKTVSAGTINLKKYRVKDNSLYQDASFSLKKDTFFYTGKYKASFTNGKTAADVNLKVGKILSGKFWYDDGTLQKEQVTPEKGPGFLKEWREDGTLERHLVYKDGKLDGLSRVFDEKGRLTQDMIFLNDEANGVSKEYIEGVAVKETVYKKGKITSETVLKANVPGVKKNLLAALNKLLPADVALATETGLTIVDDEEEDDILFLEWAALESGNYRNSYGNYVSVQGDGDRFRRGKTSTPIHEFKGKKYGWVEAEFVLQISGMSESDGEKAATLLNALHKLLTLK